VFDGLFHSSVAAVNVGVAPPKARAEVLSAPAPPKLLLVVFKLLWVDQLTPFQSSVSGALLPKAKVDVLVPPPAN